MACGRWGWGCRWRSRGVATSRARRSTEPGGAGASRLPPPPQTSELDHCHGALDRFDALDRAHSGNGTLANSFALGETRKNDDAIGRFDRDLARHHVLFELSLDLLRNKRNRLDFCSRQLRYQFVTDVTPLICEAILLLDASGPCRHRCSLLAHAIQHR